MRQIYEYKNCIYRIRLTVRFLSAQVPKEWIGHVEIHTAICGAVVVLVVLLAISWRQHPNQHKYSHTKLQASGVYLRITNKLNKLQHSYQLDSFYGDTIDWKL